MPQQQQQLKLFVNYRRADDPDFVQHMRTWFMIRYGRENVFMDFDSIPEFARFEDFIREKVRKSDAVIAVIGHNWLDHLKERERSNKPDYVRIELEEAIKFQKVIAPICIKGAPVPYSEEIPHHLQLIFQRNVAELRDGRDILDDIQRIMDNLEAQVAKQGISRVVAGNSIEASTLNQPITVFNLREALDKLSEVYEAKDWPNALGWIERIRASEEAIPDWYNKDLDALEAEILENLRIEEEARRRHEMAEYQYIFVRNMVKLKRPLDAIQRALEEVWQIVPNYDPDNIAPSRTVREPFRATLIDSGVPKMGFALGKINISEPLQNVFTISGKSNDTGESFESTQIDFSKVVRDVIGEPFEWIEILGGVVVLEDVSGFIDWRGRPGTKGGSYTIPTFEIAKYPITNKQYQVFVDAKDGYVNEKWWDYSDDAMRWRSKNPRPKNTIFLGDELPRTNVNWFDAIAFCRWIEHRTLQKISLPTEQEWQRAASGDTGWQFPWGNEPPNEARCNFAEKVGQATPVTQYPRGKSFYQVMDMSGNVLEWCLTEWSTDSINLTGSNQRIGRGGSWSDFNPDDLRVTSRPGLDPEIPDRNLGFRLARSL